MADLIGHVPLAAAPSWPTGTQPGDLVLMLTRFTQNLPSTPAGWSTVGQWSTTVLTAYESNEQNIELSSRKHYFRVSAVFASSALLSAPPTKPVDSAASATVAYRDTGGLGATRQATASAPAKAGGAIFSTWLTTSANPDQPADVTPFQVDQGFDQSRVKSQGEWISTDYRLNYGQAHTEVDGTIGDPAFTMPAFTVEILPPVAPLSPVLSAPENGADVSAGVDLDVAWTYRPVLPGGYQDAYQLQVAVVDEAPGELDWEWYDPATGATGTTETTITSGVSRSIVDGALMVADETVMVRVRAREGIDGKWSTWSSPRSSPAVTPPSVVLTGPTGTVEGDWTPTLTWTSTTPRGAQIAYQAKVLDGSDNAIFDSGPMPGTAGEFTVPVLAWAQAGYTAQVRVRQTGGSWSDWDDTAWTMSWSLPVAPTVTATAADIGIEVTVTGADADDEVELQRLDPDQTWAPVSTIALAEADPTLVDVTAPYGVDVIYRARVLSSLDGASLPSEWAESGTVRSTDAGCYLVDATAPLSSWLPVRWSGDDARPGGMERSVWRGLGDDEVSVVQGRYVGQSGRWQFTTRTAAARADLREFLLRPGRLTLRTPPELEAGDGGRRVLVDTGTTTFKVTDGPSVARLAQTGIAERWLEVEWTEAAPVRPFERQRTAGVIDLAGAVVEPGPGGTILVTVPVEG